MKASALSRRCARTRIAADQKACRGRKKLTGRVKRMWQAGEEEGRRIETLRETREHENRQIKKDQRSQEDKFERIKNGRARDRAI